MFKGIFRWKPMNEEAPLNFEIEENLATREQAEDYGTDYNFDKFEIIPYSRNVAVPVIVFVLIIVLSFILWSIR